MSLNETCKTPASRLQTASDPRTVVHWCESVPPLPCDNAIFRFGDLAFARLSSKLYRRLA